MIKSDSREMPALVTPDWLHGQMKNPDLRIVDASWYLPSAGRDPHAEYRHGHIPGAVFFDIDDIVARHSSLPHMLPAAENFSARVAALDIGEDHQVVVYDGYGVMSSARAWWMFRVFGHRQVSVLNGGLPAWKAAGLPLLGSDQDRRLPEAAPRPMQARLNPALLRTLDQVKAALDDTGQQLVDARPRGRFNGTEPEPRPGLRSGHIPGSCNLPFTDLLEIESRQMLPPARLKQRFLAAGLDLQRPITASCGSGITACVLALGLFSLGVEEVAVYDGSWAQWGAIEGLPIGPTAVRK